MKVELINVTGYQHTFEIKTLGIEIKVMAESIKAAEHRLHLMMTVMVKPEDVLVVVEGWDE